MTPHSIRKSLYIPVIGVIAYMLFTIWFFAFGPRDWNPMNKGTLYFYLSCYLLAFAAGYVLVVKMIRYKDVIEYNRKQSEKNERKILVFLKYAIWIDLIFTFLNAMQYVNINSYNLLELFRAVKISLANPSSAYYNNMYNAVEGVSILTWISILLSPVLLSARVMGILYFKKLKLYQKCVMIFSIAIEAGRWIAIGKNKGIFDIVILFLMAFIVRWVAGNAEQRKIEWKKFALIIVGIGTALCYFGFLMSSRSSNTSSGIADGFHRFPWNLVPGGMQSMVYSLNSYLCQGYYGLSLCMSLEWIPTGGLGFSGWLNRMFRTFAGIDVGELTFQNRAGVYGWHPSGKWHTMYGWFANDIHYLGVIVLMFLIGMMFAMLIKETVFEKNMISGTLLYLFFILFVYSSANNQVFMASNTTVAFLVLFFIWVLKKFLRYPKIRRRNTEDGNEYY